VRLVLRRWDIAEAMEKADIDFLFVNSAPTLRAAKGRTYTYQVDVKSRRGRVQMSLDSGPPGMTLSTTGQLSWNVPADYLGKNEVIIVSIQDASGQKLFHSFTLTME